MRKGRFNYKLTTGISLELKNLIGEVKESLQISEEASLVRGILWTNLLEIKKDLIGKKEISYNLILSNQGEKLIKVKGGNR